MSEQKNSRRDFIKKVGYATPAILSIAAAPAFAKNGSCFRGNNGIGQEKRGFFDGAPKGLEKNTNKDFNDGGKFAALGKSGAQAGGRAKD